MRAVNWCLCCLFFGLALTGCPGGGTTSVPPSSSSAPTQEQTGYFNSQFTLQNNGVASANFILKINHTGPYEDLADLQQAVHDYPNEYPDEPLYRKAWRFVKDQNTHFIPLYASTSENQDQALLYLNSPGFGFCSDVATALAYIWTSLGYQTRVWYMSGHVVPEVYTQGAWHMLDPDLRVYYLDSNGLIASVSELEKNPSLITSPLQVLAGADMTAYSENLANIYASTDNNSIDYLPAPQQDFDLAWTLPSGGSLTMPLPVENVYTTMGTFDGSEANAHIAVLTIPAGWEGEVDIPLIVYDITGSGQVSVTDSGGSSNTFAIGSSALEEYINARTSSLQARYFYKLYISATTSVQISYFINTKTMNVDSVNLLDIKGDNISDVLIN